MTDDGGVRAAAGRFRNALTQIAPSLDPATPELRNLADFPTGSCGDASLLLALYLKHCGLGSWQIVQGGSPSHVLGTHAWVEQDGLIVDITADQQEWDKDPVWITRDRDWHQQFDGTPGGTLGELTEQAVAVYLWAQEIADSQAQ